MFGSKAVFLECEKGISYFDGYDIKDMFETTDKFAEDFWEKYFIDYCVNEPARKFSDEVTHKLKEDGNEIYIITARYLTEKQDEIGIEIREIVKNWLKKYNIYYDKLIFSPDDKLEICQENKIDLMIEDRPKNILDLSKIMPVICFNAGYNRKCTGENIIRCYSWYDIYSKIKNIKQ